jgi:predicted DCC family thiol-disulfide oxidoreductase YuxK
VPTFVYDGDCAFCTSCAQMIERLLPVGRGPSQVRVVPWQFADLAALGLSAEQCEQAVQWVAVDGRVSSGPRAIADLLRHNGGGWRATGWLLSRRPVQAVAWPAYRWVARNRHRMPGGTAACSLPAAQRPQRYGHAG